MVGTLWIQGKRSPWSPDFEPPPLPASVVQAATPEIASGARFFETKGCQFCHAISGLGGKRGPDLTTVADRLSPQQLTLRILNGGYNMPGFASSLMPDEVPALVALLQTRKTPP